MSYWSELAREVVVPPPGTATTVVRATRTSPPYVGPQLISALRQLGPDFQLVDIDCDHMVAQARPAEVAALIRDRLPVGSWRG
ncbi:Lipase LipV [Mycobacterium talmoniae]|nr:Lipase LipV [Mycobacterium talmoniae]